MFPKTNIFTQFINKSGINKNSEIIIYDQIGFFSSSRVWLLFKYFGFKNVKILDGGFNIWKKNEHRQRSRVTVIEYAAFTVLAVVLAIAVTSPHAPSTQFI